MADLPITYEQLFDTLRREKSRDELQKLDKEFYEKVRIFLSMKQDTIRAESTSSGVNSLAAQRASIEYQNAKKLLKEIYDRRERKIITLAMHRTRTEATVIDHDLLLAEERAFLESLVHCLVENREQILSSVESREPIIVTPRQSYAMPTTYDQDMPRASAYPSSAGSTTIPVRQASDAEVSSGDTYSEMPEEGVKVRFTAPVPKFVGKDLRVFGPYEEGQTAMLPDEIAEILVRKGRAQELDTLPE